jgi:membrane protease YdiL (CAAX protease family)
VFDEAPPVDAIPAPRPILPIDRLEAAFEVLLCSGTTMLLLAVALYAFGIPTVTPEGALIPRAVFLVSLLDTVVVVGLVVIFLRAHDESPRQVLLGNRRVLREVGLGLVLIPVIFFVVVLILGIIIYFLPFLRNVPKNPLEAMMRTRGDAIAFAFLAMIAGGIREEVQRGFIIHRFDGFLGGGAVGVIVYSTVFGLLHYSQGWDAAIATGCLGATWGFVYLRRRSIIAPVVSHAGFNLAQVAKALALR